MLDRALTHVHKEALICALQRVHPDLQGYEFDILLAWACSDAVLDRKGYFNWRGFHLGRELFARLSEAQNWRCCYCGVRTTRYGPTGATIEHVLPKCHGGADHPDNLVMACYDCNSSRSPPLTLLG